MTTTPDEVDLSVVRQMLPFDPFDPEFATDPFPTYRKIRAESGSVFRMPGGMVSVLGYEECSAIMTDHTFGWGESPAIADQFYPDPETGELHRPLIFMDPPDHTRIRGLVSKAFTPRTVAWLRGRTEEFVRELVTVARDQSAGGEVDLMSALLRPLPGLVLAELLDIPAKYHEIFIALAKESGRGLDPGFTLTESQKQARNYAREQIMLAGDELVQERKQRPGRDLISQLALAESDGDQLSRMELQMTLMLLLAAGYNASAAMNSNIILALLRHPDQLVWLRAHPDRITGAVEELTRFDAPLQLVVRSALRDAKIGPIDVAEGDDVALILGAANRDPAAFDDPDRLDLSRPVTRNLGFGHGIHFCVAAPIGRMISQVTVSELIRHDLELAVDEPRRAPGLSMRTLDELPVRLGADH